MQYDYIIIGGGVVGLATAWQLLKKNEQLRLALIEKEDMLAAHQTGHNSGVIHSGIYYKPGSLKAQNCIRGYSMLLDFCREHDLPFELCGKLIVATSEKELPELDKLYKRGLENGLDKIKWVEQDEIKDHEPHLRGIKAIHVPYTGIIDYSEVCEKLGTLVRQMGGEIFTSHKVEKINLADDHAEIITAQKSFKAKQYINCAGLYCDKVAGFTLTKNTKNKISRGDAERAEKYKFSFKQ